MKILLWGNAPWCHSGYGEQIALLTPRFQALGHEVAIAANYGIQHSIVPWTAPNGDPVAVYPISGTRDSQDIVHYAGHFEPDIIIGLMDAWPLQPSVWPDDFRVALWAPVDHYPVPPAVLNVLQNEKVRPIAMSRFGEDWMGRFNLDPLYAPHAVDTSLFCPMPEHRDAIRDDMGIPRDAFLVMMVAANKGWNNQLSRKAFPQALCAFSNFARRHDDVWLYCQTNSVPGGSGMNLETLVMALDGQKPGHMMDRVRFPSDIELLLGLPRPLLATQYAAADVLLNPSMGEGFGVPLIEAQACGVPVIASDHSAMTELAQAGWLVAGDPFWDALQDSFAFMPYIGAIDAALEKAYEERDKVLLRAAAREFALGYDIDLVVTSYWEPIIEKLRGPREVPPLKKRKLKAAA